MLLSWKVDKEISDDLNSLLSVFKLWWDPKGLPWFPRAPNGWPDVPWEVEIIYFTKGWFTIGLLSITHLISGRGKLANLRHFLAVFRHWRPPKIAPEGSQGLPMANLVRQEKWRWNILLWDGFTMGKLASKVDKGISYDLRHVLAVLGTKGPPKDPRGSPMVPNGQSSIPWELYIIYFTLGHCLKAMANLLLPQEPNVRNGKIKKFTNFKTIFVVL